MNKLVILAGGELFQLRTTGFKNGFMEANIKHSVLIIDDDLDYLEIVRRGLGNEFEIFTIGSFQSLKEEIYGLRPSLILLDMHLGNTKPEDVINFMRSLDFLKATPLYLISGSDAGRKVALEKDVNGFMVKPATFPGVRDMIHAALNQQSSLSGK